MGKHYTERTVSDTVYCKKCGTFTEHAVMNKLLAHCLECLRKAEAKRLERLTLPKQESLF